ncbi:MAG: 30S ribosomal protein S6 [Candidatus Azambacteria bacterium]|nr:30S ribosomal protein S6 [Candidatus Azambacteria bacterium]
MNEPKNTREYEISYLLTIDIPEDKLEKEVAELRNLIAKNNGAVTFSELPKKRFLSYSVKKQREAYLGVVYFNADANEIDEIKKAFTLYKNILRFLIVNEVGKPEPITEVLPMPPTDSSAPTQSFDQRLENILKS